MFGLIAAESAIFTIFVVAYLFYVGKSLTGPDAEGRSQCPDLLHDLFALEQSDDSLRRAKLFAGVTSEVFGIWWFADDRAGRTLSCTEPRTEWHRLIYHEGLTISTNLFGTTYYSLVGLHGFHVVVGLIGLSHRDGVHASGDGESRTR